MDTLLEGVEPLYVMAHSYGGYTTNLPVEDITDGKAWVAYAYDGAPLEPEHGGRRGCWCRTCTSGRAPSGCAGSSSWTRTSPASGSRSATTTTGTRGVSSATRATELAGRRRRGGPRDDPRDTVGVHARARRSRLAGPPAGQHVDLRLTAEDGYQATRSYSVASAPEDDDVALTIERLDDGEVSPYLVDEARPGDQPEPGAARLRLVVDGGRRRPAVPGRGRLRPRAADGDAAPPRARRQRRRGPAAAVGPAPQDVLYAGELPALVEPAITYTREAPAGWTGYARRVDGEMLAEAKPERAPAGLRLRPDRLRRGRFAELVALGHDTSRIRTERFGATGG